MGASITVAFLLAKVSDSLRISVGELVLRSNQTEFSETPSNKLFSPVATASTSTGPGREVNITSHFSAISFGLSAHSAPNSSIGVAELRSRSCTIILYPDLAIFMDIPPPMFPRPINPTTVSATLLI